MKPILAVLISVLLASAAVHAADEPVKPLRVAILLFDGVQIIDFAAPYEVFGQAGFDVRTVSRDGKPVTTAMKLSVNVDDSFETSQQADIVVVPGGDVQVTAKDAVTQAWIRKQAEPARAVLSICTGSDILASTGLLDGHSATTFHKHFDHLASTYPKVTVVRDQRWVEAGKIVTSAGLASGVDAALHVVAKLRGEHAARSVALHLEYDWSPDKGFVRGLMADQFIRMPAAELKFPEGTQFKQLTSVGNRKYWEIDYRVSTPVSAQDLLAQVGTQAADDDALTVLKLPDPLQLAWQYASERGGRWRLSFRATDTQLPGEFHLQAKIVKLD